MFPFGSFDGRLEPIPINKSRIKVESSPGFNFGVWHQQGSRTRGPLDYWTANIVTGAEPYDMAHSPRNSSALMVFEPE